MSRIYVLENGAQWDIEEIQHHAAQGVTRLAKTQDDMTRFMVMAHAPNILIRSDDLEAGTTMQTGYAYCCDNCAANALEEWAEADFKDATPPRGQPIYSLTVYGPDGPPGEKQ